jgi:hypothetical protein
MMYYPIRCILDIMYYYRIMLYVCYKMFCQIMKNCIKTCLETICTFLKYKYLGRIFPSISTGYQN